MSHGDLHTILRKNSQLTWIQRVQFAIDAAKGMAYLHSLDPPVLHRDLKGVNLLIDDNFTVRIADFGLSKALPECVSSRSSSALGTLNWLAPEVLSQECSYTTKADIFSFGMVMFEIATNSTPFSGLSPLQIVRSLDCGRRPTIPDNICDDYARLISKCWAQDYNMRPEFDEILVILENIKKDAETL